MGQHTASTAPEHRHVALNASQGGKRIAALCFELPQADANRKTLTIIPAPDADGRVRGIDGRTWWMKDRDAVLKAFTRRRAITENHARLLVAPKGGAAPAFGWIEGVRAAADGGIEFDPNWNPRGETAISNRDYLYLSPEFEHDKAGNILAIVGAALTNDPNFPQLALNSEGEHDPEHPPMNLTAIARALGLAETADEAAVITAINALKTERETALNAAKVPDPAKFKPIEEFNVALNRATTAEAELKTLKDGQVEAKINAALDAALNAGKIVPASRDHYLAICRMEGGLSKFEELMKTQPVIAEPTKTDRKPDGGGDVEDLTPNQLAICRQMGMDPKTYAASLKATTA